MKRLLVGGVVCAVVLTGCPPGEMGGDTGRTDVVQQDRNVGPDRVNPPDTMPTDVQVEDVVVMDVIEVDEGGSAPPDVVPDTGPDLGPDEMADSRTEPGPETGPDAMDTCPTSTPTRCAAGTGSICVDLMGDMGNCGRCGNTCTAGQTCQMGTCRCPTGQANCGGRCISTQDDNMNCGGCGVVCPAGTSCRMGSCSCPAGQTLCNGRCVDTMTSAAHCGMCGNLCGGGRTCQSGSCECPTGQLICGGICTDTRTDRGHCGRCGNACPGLQVCSNGACSISCSPELRACGSGTNMTCVNLQTDSANCGACGTRCGTGQSCVAGRCVCPMGQTACGTGTSASCVDAQTDNNNCGTCGTVCPVGRQCRMGRCDCTGGRQLCGRPPNEVCLDTQNDNNNCGDCGVQCVAGPNAATPACLSGACTAICAPGFGDCDNNVINGCETPITSDRANCGACGVRCGVGQRCNGGMCEACAPGAVGCCAFGEIDCGLPGGPMCIAQTDTNCGMCGRACDTAMGERCVVDGVSGNGSCRRGFTSYTVSRPTGVAFDNACTAMGGVVLRTTGDDQTSNISSLPFPITLFDRNFTTATVVTNGNIQFTTSSTTFTNSCLPTGGFDYSVLPFWDDLNLNVSGRICHATVGTGLQRRFVVTFEGVGFFGSTAPIPGSSINVSAAFYEATGAIEFQYGTLTGGVSGGESATIGLRRNSTTAVQVGCNPGSRNGGDPLGPAIVTSNSTVRFTGVP